jgi:hydroxyethylthiazole kinase-like uncharacterized protein yjeF
MEILTGTQMQRVDAKTIDRGHATGAALMEQAGRGIAEAMAQEIPDLGRRPIFVLCGKGNNGGDGLVASRHLVRLGALPRVALFARGEDLRGDPGIHLRRAVESGVAVEEIAAEEEWSRVCAAIGPDGIVVDALLGTGASGPARGLYARAIEDVNASGATVVAVDLPSGIDADTGRAEGPAILAHRTYTLCRPKAGLVLPPGDAHAGRFRVIDIGIRDDVVAEESPALTWTDVDAASSLLPPRPRTAHKGTMGHLLAITGSRGKTGAAVLLARAALRSGVGLVTIGAPRSCLATIAAGQAEAMTEPLPESRAGALSAAALSPARKLLAVRDALALGPGLGLAPGTASLVRALVRARTAPTVLDADGLNAFGAVSRAAGLTAGTLPMVLTPHPGEAARLLATSAGSVQADRLGAARSLARSTGAVVVLKGAGSIVASADGNAAFNATGNPGMATGGTGDALTGVIGALLARGMSAFDAARLGTYVHGDAGDRAAGRLGEDGMIAGDLVAELPESWVSLHGIGAERKAWTRDV